MCGRFENAINHEELDRIFSKYIGKLHIDYDIDEVLYTQNIAPTDKIRAIFLEDDKYKVKNVRWGIRSKIYDATRIAKGKDPNIEKDIFNSKLETISKTNSWKQLFQSNRCLIPMTAFYEWIPVGDKKIPQRISIDNEPCFFSAAIYKTNEEAKEISASVITCPPNHFMKPVHNRMPIMFKAEDAGNFLNLPFEGIPSVCTPLNDSIDMQMEEAHLIKNN